MRPRTHQALVCPAPGTFRLAAAAARSPRQGEVLVRIRAAGVCGTDLDILRACRHDCAKILGHEGIGEITETGSQVAGFAVGRQVIFNPVNSHDQNAILGHSLPGLFQTQRLFSAAEILGGHLVPCNPSLPPMAGPLVEPLGTVLYGQDLVGEDRLGRVIVFGAGPIGLLHAIRARSIGCRDLTIVNPSRQRLDWATANGIVAANEAVLAGPRNFPRLLASEGARGADTIFLCCPRAHALDALRAGLDLIRPGGCIDLVGGIADGDTVAELPGIDLNSVRRANACGCPARGCSIEVRTTAGKAVRLTGHRGTSASHLGRAVELLVRDPERYLKIITHVVSMQRAAELLSRLAGAKLRRIDGRHFVKLVIDMDREGPQSDLPDFDGNTL